MNGTDPRYKILAGRNVNVLNKLVNEHLDQGYGLVGSPYTSSDSHYQAVIKPVSFVNWDLLNKINGCELKEE